MLWKSNIRRAAIALAGLLHQAKAIDEFEGYIWAHMVNDTVFGENIFFAASNGNDALSWTSLNNGNPAITSNLGTKGLRDPFILRSHDGNTFYLLATDLSIGRNKDWDLAYTHGSRYLEIWESKDLVHWSEQRHTLVSPKTAGMSWAPEAYWDDAISKYVVYWASALYDNADKNHTGESYSRMLYATTEDFVHFSEARVWQDWGSSRIDSTVIKVGDLYYRWTKDDLGPFEDTPKTGCRDIMQEHSRVLTATLEDWTVDEVCMGTHLKTTTIEGPNIFKSNANDIRGEKYYLFVDESSGRGYIPLETKDLALHDWKISEGYSFPGRPRHGSVIPVTAAELKKFKEGWANCTAPPHPEKPSPPGHLPHPGKPSHPGLSPPPGRPCLPGKPHP